MLMINSKGGVDCQGSLTVVSAVEDAWQAGRRAWERLAGWLRDEPSTHPDTGDAAVDALDDISVVRRLLDQAELVAGRPARRRGKSWAEIATRGGGRRRPARAELAAVRTARRHGKSWAETATRLGASRQSAWERGRAVDDEPSG